MASPRSSSYSFIYIGLRHDCDGLLRGTQTEAKENRAKGKKIKESCWLYRPSTSTIQELQELLSHVELLKSMYEMKGLYGIEAIELLRWVAFKNNQVPSSYEEILNRAVRYASGLPLAIEIIGSNLFRKSIEEWKNTLEGYEKIPNKEIQKILRISYDALEEEEQSVFLDIACCFKGSIQVEVENILHAHYGHCIKHHVGVLAEKSLIKINSHGRPYVKVTLHDLIEDMGKEVVRQESPKELGERSRLWHYDDIIQVLKEKTVSKIDIYEHCSF
ncbi:disease resistance protein RUN1-like [Vicia villosa]|uniref:disease resistance protein RUN1-like n=1 Tax=Vicia villosa TaxID=3911 RepID=UPI00273C5B40|nr:disease resistance protein RUN1-like [Vicia villosa]